MRVLQKILTWSCLLMAVTLLSGCTTSAISQLKESPCKECTSKTVFYRNGEWLYGGKGEQ